MEYAWAMAVAFTSEGCSGCWLPGSVFALLFCPDEEVPSAHKRRMLWKGRKPSAS